MAEVVAHPGNTHLHGGLSVIADELRVAHTAASRTHSEHGGLIKGSPDHGSGEHSPSHTKPSHSPGVIVSPSPSPSRPPPPGRPPRPPPSPPPPSLTDPPSTPIIAYCIPYTDEYSTGCIIKVVEVQLGTDILFRLESTAGEHAQVPMDMHHATPFTDLEFGLYKSILPQASLSGTVEYVGMPQYKWKVGTMDPSATVTKTNQILRLRDGRLWQKYNIEIPLRRQPYRGYFYRRL